MPKRRPSKRLQADSNKKNATPVVFPTAILDEASKDFSFEFNFLVVAASGVILLTGWVDDRSSKLRQVRLSGEAWSKVIDHRHIGRHRRADTRADLNSTQRRFFGFWALTVHDRTLIKGKSCSVELA